MKIRVTFMTENEKHLNITKEEILKNTKVGWEIICKMLNSYNPEEKITLEKCELVEM